MFRVDVTANVRFYMYFFWGTGPPPVAGHPRGITEVTVRIKVHFLVLREGK